jgi:3-oxoacyl-[acyl-carrier-protein] synthase II
MGHQFACRLVLQGSGVGTQHLQYINAHATSTPMGDEIEQRAIMTVFGGRPAPAPGPGGAVELG